MTWAKIDTTHIRHQYFLTSKKQIEATRTKNKVN